MISGTDWDLVLFTVTCFLLGALGILLLWAGQKLGE